MPDSESEVSMRLRMALIITIVFVVFVILLLNLTSGNPPHHRHHHHPRPASTTTTTVVPTTTTTVAPTTTTTVPPAPPVAVPVAPVSMTGPSPTVYAEWTRVAICEEGGWVGYAGSAYPDSIGISDANWWAYGGGTDLSPDAQIVVGQRIEAAAGMAGYVPDQYGCAPW